MATTGTESSAGTIPSSRSLFLPVDIQEGFKHPSYYGPNMSNPSFETNIKALYDGVRAASIPIIHIKHDAVDARSPLAPGSPGNAFRSVAQPLPSEPVIAKKVHSSFIGTGLEKELLERGTRRLIVCGISTDHCVSTTVRMAKDLGVTDHRRADGTTEEGEVLLVGDATAAFGKGGFDGELIQKVQLASLDGEFCRVVSTAQLLAEMKTW